jgi:GT2 family glycosyltransferase
MISIVTPVMSVHPVLIDLTMKQVESVQKNTVNEWELIYIIHGRLNKEILEVPEWNKILIDELYPIPNVRVKTYDRNVGIAKAFNVGFNKMARGDVFCLMHNDVELPDRWDVELRKEAQAGALAFPLVEESQACEMRGARPMFSDQVPSCCWMVSKAVWDEIGGMDELFEDIHWEDTDFFRRAQQAGKQFVRCNTTVFHYRAATRTLLPDKGNGNFLVNRAKYCAKHGVRLDKPDDLPRLEPVTTGP